MMGLAHLVIQNILIFLDKIVFVESGSFWLDQNILTIVLD